MNWSVGILHSVGVKKENYSPFGWSVQHTQTFFAVAAKPDQSAYFWYAQVRQKAIQISKMDRGGCMASLVTTNPLSQRMNEAQSLSFCLSRAPLVTQ